MLKYPQNVVIALWSRVLDLVATTLATIGQRIPRRLPQRDAELPRFITRICALADVPPNDSFEQAICTAIMHIGSNQSWCSDKYFVSNLQASIAKQVAYNRLSLIKEAQKEAQKNAQNEKTVGPIA